MTKKFSRQTNLVIDDNCNEKLHKKIKENLSKIMKLEMEVIYLQKVLKSTKKKLILRNKFLLNLSYTSFFLSAVALALSLAACL